MNKRFVKTLIAIGAATMLMMLFVACDTNRVSVNAGSTWEVTESTSLTIAEGAIIKAPIGYTLTMTVNGVETPIKAGAHKGQIVLTVNKAMSEGGPGGPSGPGFPGGPGGPGGSGNLGAEAMTAEPIVSAAESLFADFDAVKNKDAVTAMFDFGFIDGYPGDEGGLAFCPEDDLTLAGLAKAVSMATLLVSGGMPSDCIAYCVEKGLFEGTPDPDKPVTGYDTAKMLLSALGVRGVAGDASKVAVDTALKQYNLAEGLGDIDLSQVISRDNAAQMIANALFLSDGSAYMPKVLHNSPIRLDSGVMTVENTRIFNYGGSAIENSGESVLVVRNSRVDGDTSVTTKPLAGNPGGLLIAGSIRTTLALNRAQAFYINSEVISKDWAALSTDGARPVTEPGETELSVYAYGSSTKTTEGGYGTYSDLFCNVYLYGTKMDSAEIGIISGTYGTVTVGTIEDGEASDALAAQLIAPDREARMNKSAGSVVTGGRNAVMVHSVSLPPYWEYDGYSQEELPLYSAKISVHGSTLATDLGLEKNVEYPAERKAYIDHHAGSVILVKSCNADIVLDKAEVISDKKGAGALIHTIINNDSMFMIKVPDGEVYPGVKVRMTDMNAEGDILNEDYQRDMFLSLADSSLTGKIISGTAESWNALCREKGFESYIIDPDGYGATHGVSLMLDSGSVWNVTGESTLTNLTIGAGAVIKAAGSKTLTMTVNGIEEPIRAGAYKGRIVLSVTKS